MRDYDQIDLYLESQPRTKPIKALVYGVGINDSNFPVSMRLGNKRCVHRAYEAWHGMMARCYSSYRQRKYPSYVGCMVDEGWLTFSNFYSWWKENYKEEWQVDKDLLVPGNKVYSSQTCTYIPQDLNTFTVGNDRSRGEWPIGVSLNKKSGLFMSMISLGDNKHKYLGSFNDPYDAHAAWHAEKVTQAEKFRALCSSIHPKLFDGLILKINAMKE